MPQPDAVPLLNAIRQLEQQRDSRVLVLAASRLDMELLPALFEQCSRFGRTARLDVVLHSRGGVVNAARRIALLLRGCADHLSFIVPYHCESAGTLLTLAADEIVAGELALFSPIDPQLHGGGGADGAPSSFSCQDIRQFGAMGEDWFGVDGGEARQQALALLCNSVFPPTLTAFYRTTLELRQIGEELLAFQLPAVDAAARARIVEQLMFGYHSHGYALTGAELARMGLSLRRQPATEALAWTISRVLQDRVGGGLRQSADEAWTDALFASRDGAQLRLNPGGGMLPRWRNVELGA